MRMVLKAEKPTDEIKGIKEVPSCLKRSSWRVTRIGEAEVCTEVKMEMKRRRKGVHCRTWLTCTLRMRVWKLLRFEKLSCAQLNLLILVE